MTSRHYTPVGDSMTIWTACRLGTDPTGRFWNRWRKTRPTTTLPRWFSPLPL